MTIYTIIYVKNLNKPHKNYLKSNNKARSHCIMRLCGQLRLAERHVHHDAAAYGAR